MRRVVITGMGTLNPMGDSVNEFWNSLVAGKSAAGLISKFDSTHFKTKFACEVKNPALSKYLSNTEIKRADPYVQYGLYAASQALEDSGIDLSKINSFDAGVIWGTGQGGLTTIEDSLQEFHTNQNKPNFHPLYIPKMLGSMASGMIALKFGLQGVNFTNQSACASSNAALMEAALFIKSNKAKIMVVGGSDAPITASTVGGFNALRALSTKNEAPASASKPFDKNRDGFVLSEGAAALILEDYEHAKARGANIYAELVGTAISNDAYHLTASHPEGKGAVRAMEEALKEAKLSAQDINYLNPHATSTPVGDRAEAAALKQVWNLSDPSLKVSATKSMTGHHLGAAGAIEAIICIQTILNNTVAPTINTVDLETGLLPDCHFVTEEAIEAKINCAMSNSFGFGGYNAVSIFKRFID